MNDVTVFGVSKGGSLGVTTNNVPLAPTKPELINTLPPIIDIICGEAFTFIRCENNDIYFCGDNPTFLFFELEETEIRIPTKLRYFEERGIIIREIHVGRSHASFVSTTNDVYYSGGNDYFQRGIPRMDHQPNNHPRLNKMDNLLFNHETVITAPCGVYSSLVQTETQDESHLWIFGCDYFDTPQMYNNIVQIDTRCLGSQRIVQISHGFCFFLVLTNLGNVGICGLNYQQQLGIQESTTPFRMLAFPDHKKIWKIAAGPYHSLFLTTDNELYVAGERYHYDNNGDESNVLHKVALQGNVILKEIAGGWNLTVGITDCDRVILFASSNIGEMVDDVKKGQFFVENVSGKTRVAVTNGGAILWLGTMNKIKKAFPLVQAWKRFYDLEIKIK